MKKDNCTPLAMRGQARGAAVVVLDPQRLGDAAAAAARGLLTEGESANTRASYASALRYWVAWFGLRYGRIFDAAQDLPTAPATVVQFIVDHAQRQIGPEPGSKVLEAGADGETMLRHELPEEIDRALMASGVKGQLGPMANNTLRHRLAALAKLHRARGLDSPTDHHDVRRLMVAVRKAYAKRGQRPASKDALDGDLLKQLLATCDASPKGVRDRALLYFAFVSGGRRRSEVAGADLAQLKAMPNLGGLGPGYTFHLGASKTNQVGEDRPEDHKPIGGQAGVALRAWMDLLKASGITEGKIFRQVRRGGKIGERLSGVTVWKIVTARCAAAGLEGDFGAHSLRSGFMTEAARHNIPLNEMMDFSGHRDIKTAMGYIKKARMETSKAGSLLEDG
jgi:integrase